MHEILTADAVGGTSRRCGSRPKVWLQVYVVDVNDAVGLPSFRRCADTAFWSPPYKKKDGFSLELMETTGQLLGTALRGNAWAFMNFAQLREDFWRPQSAASAVLVGADGKLTAHQQYVWLKSLAIDGTQRGHYTPLQSKNILNYCFEFVFSFYAGAAEPPLDRLAVGTAFADKSNLKRGKRGKNGDLHCAGDVWWLPYKTTGATKKKAHDYEFPYELPLYALKLAGLKPGKTVLDPFLGSGPTALAAKDLGLNCVGIERDPKRARAAIERWVEHKQP